MATHKKCSVCEKGPGICLCVGCNRYFCRKDFNDHHTTLLTELETILGDRNDLQDKINTTTQNKDLHSPVLVQIDEWERTISKKVNHVAEQARQQATTLFDSERMKTITRFEAFSKQLIHLKETEDVVEEDLIHLKETVCQLHQNLEQLTQAVAIQLCTEQSDQIEWSNLIHVKPTVSDNPDRKQQPEARDQSAKADTKETSAKFYHDVKLLLDKITQKTYDEIQQQLEECGIDRYEKLEDMVDIIFCRAINEPDVGCLLAKLCKHFQKKSVTMINEKNITVTTYFRQTLLTLCQETFENDGRQEIEYNKRKNEIEKIAGRDIYKKAVKRLDDDLANVKRKKLNNIRFIGELFKLQMLTDTIMHDCIKHLLQDKTDDENLKCLCGLLRTIGKELDTKAKEKPTSDIILEEYYRELNNILMEQQVSAPVCRMIQELIDLKKGQWMVSRSEGARTTIDHVQEQ